MLLDTTKTNAESKSLKMELKKLLEKKKKRPTNNELNLSKTKYELFAVLEYTIQAGKGHFTTLNSVPTAKPYVFLNCLTAI